MEAATSAAARKGTARMGPGTAMDTKGVATGGPEQKLLGRGRQPRDGCPPEAGQVARIHKAQERWVTVCASPGQADSDTQMQTTEQPPQTGWPAAPKRQGRQPRELNDTLPPEALTHQKRERWIKGYASPRQEGTCYSPLAKAHRTPKAAEERTAETAPARPILRPHQQMELGT